MGGSLNLAQGLKGGVFFLYNWLNKGSHTAANSCFQILHIVLGPGLIWGVFSLFILEVVPFVTYLTIYLVMNRPLYSTLKPMIDSTRITVSLTDVYQWIKTGTHW